MNSSINIPIGEAIRSYLESKGLTQCEVAERLGMTQGAVSAYYRGKVFGKNAAQKWSEAFGFRENWLRTGEGAMLKGDTSQSSKGDNTIQVSGTNVDMRNINQSKNTGDEKRVKELERRIEELTEDKRRLQEMVDKMQAQITKLLEKI